MERPVHVVAERELITQNCEWKKKKMTNIRSRKLKFLKENGSREIVSILNINKKIKMGILCNHSGRREECFPNVNKPTG